MSSTTYNAITIVLGATALAALGVALYSLIFMLVGWKTENRRRHIIRLILAVALVPCLAGIQYSVLFFVFLPALHRQQMSERSNVMPASDTLDTPTSFVSVGDYVDDFALPTIDGELFSIAKGRGKVIVINFFATSCKPCLLELPHIQEVWEENRNLETFQLVVVGQGQSLSTVRAFCRENGYSFPCAGSKDVELSSPLFRGAIPRTFVVSPDGTIVHAEIGYTHDSIASLKSALSTQLKMIAEAARSTGGDEPDVGPETSNESFGDG